MNIEILLKFVSPYINSNNQLTYEEFDKVFSSLEKKEQYQIMEYLESKGIEFVDEKSTEQIKQTEPIETPKDEQKEKKTFIVTNKENSKIEEDIKEEFEEELIKNTQKSSRNSISNSLTKETNEALVFRFQKTKNRAFLDALIKKNKNYIYKLANKISRIYVNDFDDDDIYQIACCGFIKGCERYDYNCGCKLITYATFWIKQQLTRELINTGSSVRVPVHMWDKILKVRRLLSDFPEASHKELAEKAELSIEKFNQIIELMRNYLTLEYLDKTINDSDSTTVLDSISNDKNYANSSEVEKDIEEKFLNSAIENAITNLSPRERDVLRLRFGIDDKRQRTLNEVGQLFDVTRERIRQIEQKALRKLRNPKVTKEISDFSLKTPHLSDKEKEYASCFKKNGASCVPTAKDIIETIYKKHPKMSKSDLYEECVKCAKVTGYGDFESMNYFLDVLSRLN